MLGDLLGKSKYGYRKEEEEKEDPTQTVRRIVSTLKAYMEGGGGKIYGFGKAGFNPSPLLPLIRSWWNFFFPPT